MINVGLLSDTHGSLPDGWRNFFTSVDEIWHAGDIGAVETAITLEEFKPLRAVHGNIDNITLTLQFPEVLLFDCEKLKVLITHIGGNPGKYHSKAFKIIEQERPGLFICGHSHILKVIYDKKHDMLHINPGAAGNFGIHTNITMVRFSVDGNTVTHLEVFDRPRNFRK